MIVARAPLRISFAGGGTDLPAYYERYGGLVLNATISLSVYAVLSPGDYDGVPIVLSDYRTMRTGDAGRDYPGEGLSLPAAVAQAMGLEQGASIFLTVEAPPGTGLGSSSAMAVALITAIAAHEGCVYTPPEVAELASRIEIERLGAPIGKQDQYAAAHGGINIFQFDSRGVGVVPVALSPAVCRGLDECLVLYFTGTRRRAATILQEQQSRTARGEDHTLASLHAMKEQVAPMRLALEAGDVAAVGALLHEAWEHKRQVSSGVSTAAIDRAYAGARAAGALGGKITGAGGGGFLLLVVPPRAQPDVRAALAALGLTHTPFTLEQHGAHLLAAPGRGSPGGDGPVVGGCASGPAGAEKGDGR